MTTEYEKALQASIDRVVEARELLDAEIDEFANTADLAPVVSALHTLARLAEAAATLLSMAEIVDGKARPKETPDV